MRVLLVPFGSHGDVHPFLALGHAFRDRGHQVTFILNEMFGPLVRGLGFEHVPLGDDARLAEVANDPDLWHPRKAFGVVAKTVLEATRLTYPLIVERYVPGETVVVGGSLALSTRLAHESIGIPAATVHLQPSILFSNEETPTFPNLGAVTRWPRWLKRPFFDFIYSRGIDPSIAPGLNAFRAELGLPPVRDVMRVYLHAPQLVLGFFPSWFAGPQPDWPPQVKLVGFPLYDERDATPMPPELERFLTQGTPPIAFTPGSANQHGRAFFDASAEACRLLGRRGILLSRYTDNVPPALPDGVIHCPYSPFGTLLPKVAALVHHGGIGTSAQAMASAVPQLVMPLAHDQFDNAARMKRRGIARVLVPSKFRGPAVAKELHALIDDPDVKVRCRGTAALFHRDPHPMDAACDAIEALEGAVTTPSFPPRP